MIALAIRQFLVGQSPIGGLAAGDFATEDVPAGDANVWRKWSALAGTAVRPTLIVLRGPAVPEPRRMFTDAFRLGRLAASELDGLVPRIPVLRLAESSTEQAVEEVAAALLAMR
jgi:hypothetical protein